MIRILIISITKLLSGDAAAKPQWKAAIDFKWIRENKEALAANIKNRNSNANLEAVLELYDKMSNLQKVIVLIFLFRISFFAVFFDFRIRKKFAWC